ncbi:Cysteine-rich protein [Phytophthora cinnamomi]|uniref:Cysteine-rich protein n=1 Tax=Phytophthora cinnamomi TaxID=4785 RepID=UPI00355A7C35|nr:Cysteine-rich protein [Phytophthora cinnamomi]
MKISTVFVAAFAAAACLLQPTAAEDQASVHLRVHLEKDVCYVQCPSGQYCPNDGKKQCRAPRGKECFDPSQGQFRPNGCDPGFKCSSGKCVYN